MREKLTECRSDHKKLIERGGYRPTAGLAAIQGKDENDDPEIDPDTATQNLGRLMRLPNENNSSPKFIILAFRLARRPHA